MKVIPVILDTFVDRYLRKGKQILDTLTQQVYTSDTEYQAELLLNKLNRIGKLNGLKMNPKVSDTQSGMLSVVA